MYTLVERHLSRVHLSRANFLYSHDLSDAQLTWNKVAGPHLTFKIVTFTNLREVRGNRAQ